MVGRPLMVDLTGQRFGRLMVMERAPNKGKKVCWWCRCDCGMLTSVQTFNLLFGLTTSCGCYRMEKLLEARERRKSNKRNSI